jgi:hypothetical protein
LAFYELAREIKRRVKRQGLWGFGLFLAVDIARRLLEHRILSWANEKLDSNIDPVLKTAAIALKFIVEHPILFMTWAVLLACIAIIAGSFVTVSRKARGTGKDRWPELEIGKSAAAEGLLVWLQNNSDEHIAECTLFLVGLDQFSKQTREFKLPGIFNGVWLIKPQPLSPSARSESGYLVKLPNVERQFLETPDATDQRPAVFTRAYGTWRARINVITSLTTNSRQEELFFQWTAGAMPVFIHDPGKTS